MQWLYVQLNMVLLLMVDEGAAPTIFDVTAITLPAVVVGLELELDVELASVVALVTVAFGLSDEVLSPGLSVELSPPPEVFPVCDALFEGDGDAEASVEVIDGVVGPSRL
jgi:hypothetical protein